MRLSRQLYHLTCDAIQSLKTIFNTFEEFIQGLHKLAIYYLLNGVTFD